MRADTCFGSSCCRATGVDSGVDFFSCLDTVSGLGLVSGTDLGLSSGTGGSDAHAADELLVLVLDWSQHLMIV